MTALIRSAGVAVEFRESSRRLGVKMTVSVKHDPVVREYKDVELQPSSMPEFKAESHVAELWEPLSQVERLNILKYLSIISEMGKVLRRSGYFVASLECAQIALAMHTFGPVPVCNELMDAVALSVLTLIDTGLWEESFRLIHVQKALLMTVVDSERQDSADSLLSVGLILANAWKFDLAKEMVKDAQAILDRTVGSPHPRQADALLIKVRSVFLPPSTLLTRRRRRCSTLQVRSLPATSR